MRVRRRERRAEGLTASIGTSAPSLNVRPAPTVVASVPVRPHDPTVDTGNWAEVVDAAGLSGMVRQFALNCVPAAFDNHVLKLQFDHAVEHRRTQPNRGQARAVSIGLLWARDSGCLRGLRIGAHHAGAPARHGRTGQDVASGGVVRRGSRRQGSAGAFRRRDRRGLGKAKLMLVNALSRNIQRGRGGPAL